MATVTKKDLIDRIADKTGGKRVAVKLTVQEFLDQIINELEAGNRLEFRDFGVFEIKERAARMAQNPKTLERVPVPAKRTVRFKVGRRMREALETVAPPVESGSTEAAAASGDGQASLKVRSGIVANEPPMVRVTRGVSATSGSLSH